MGVQFEWDRMKAASNLQKHGVTFDEATTVFRDTLACIFDDEAHSDQEQREIIVGHSTKHRLLDRLLHRENRKCGSDYQCTIGNKMGTRKL